MFNNLICACFLTVKHVHAINLAVIVLLKVNPVATQWTHVAILVHALNS